MRPNPTARTPAPAHVAAGSPTAIEQYLLEQRDVIEAWFDQQLQRTPAPFYCSVDLRNAGYKLAPVDTNLFPAGFNNLSRAALAACAPAVRTAVARVGSAVHTLVLIPENHTRNRFYLENIGALAGILRTAGLTVHVGSLPQTPNRPTAVPTGEPMSFEPLRRDGRRVHLADVEPDLVLLNNDLCAGVPTILTGVAQAVVPPPSVGWAVRRKSNHFAKYRMLAQEFCQLLRVDPWLIDPLSYRCDGIDFHRRAGEDRLAELVDRLLTKVAAKYREHGITRQPFAAIKADAGTYGMSVVMVRAGDEVRHFNRRQRAKMAVAKDGVPVTEVVVQEGVPTIETATDPPAPAEPVVYMIDRFVVGGFYRVHSGKGSDDNLNAPGMAFAPMALTEAEETPEHVPTRARRYAYRIVARLAALAAGREIQDVQDKV